MFESILLAVGGDDASMEPARAAGRLAQRIGVPLTLMSVYHAAGEALGEPYYSRRLADRRGHAIAALDNARRLAEAEGGTVATLDPFEGQPAQQIVEVAQSGGFHLIVVGTRRRGRVQSALLGSVSAAVAAHSPVPVLIVPETPLAEPTSGSK